LFSIRITFSFLLNKNKMSTFFYLLTFFIRIIS
jgi:hypothetical protein